MSRISRYINGIAPERHGNRRRREEKKTQEDRRSSREGQQVNLELESDERVGAVKVESSSKSCWWRQTGWVPPEATETQQRPVWSVADEETTLVAEERILARILWGAVKTMGGIKLGGRGGRKKLAFQI